MRNLGVTNKEIELVKASWANVVPISNLAAELFYGKLFEIDPALKSLFSDNLEEQGKKLMMMINTAVNGLDSPEQIVDAHYDTVGAALIWTLGQGLGDGFTDEVKNAWLNTYTLLACTMKEGAAEVDAA
jgi:hemoglobin-like flavoprotein